MRVRSTSLGWLLKADAYRVSGVMSWRSVARQLVWGETYSYVFWMRVCAHLSRAGPAGRVLLVPARLVLRRLRYRIGINIPYVTTIGPGFLVGHAGGVVVNAACVIGANCNLSHGVTIGSSKGARAGVPTIGDDVYIGPGAVVVGRITIGNGAAIGANSVVVDDVPEHVTVAGAPARVVSAKGSSGWVNRCNYPPPRSHHAAHKSSE